jgi:hypothetical protein
MSDSIALVYGKVCSAHNQAENNYAIQQFIIRKKTILCKPKTAQSLLYCI